jgi:hypothetical protein
MIIVSLLCIVLSLVLSNYWAPQLSLFDNVMMSLRVEFFEHDGFVVGEKLFYFYYIDIPTKYLIFTFISAAAYGVLVCLGIVPIPWKKKIKQTERAV